MNTLRLGDIAQYSDSRIGSSALTVSSYVGTDNILQNKQGKKDSSYVPAEGKVTRYITGDILVANIRPYLKKIWLADGEGGSSPDVSTIRVTNHNFLPDFVYYSLIQDVFFDYAMKGAKGSKMPRLDKRQVMDFPVANLGVHAQTNIVKILGFIDKKINLNSKINERLGLIAKLVYDQWFVQFDFPDANNRPYKTAGGAMVYSEELRRDIPVVWKVQNLSKIAKIASGFPFKSTEYVESGKYKIITIKNVLEGEINSSTADTIDNLPARLPEVCKLSVGDILISLTGNVGRMGIVFENDLLLNQRVGKVMTVDEKLKYFTYFLLSSAEHRLRLERFSNGSSQANLSPVQAIDFLTFIPSEDIIASFNKLVDPLTQQYITRKQETVHLVRLRDFLLPMLMNGQVVVKD